MASAASSPSSSQPSSRGPGSRASSPAIPVQPDHFYGHDAVQFPPSPHSEGRAWLDPKDDPNAERGIPVFRPTMAEFADFEEYMNRVEPWGVRSGIVKIIPRRSGATERLPSVVPQLGHVKLTSPIEQRMEGSNGRYLQCNMEKRRTMSVRDWAELCAQDQYRAPGVHEMGGRNARAKDAGTGARRTRRSGGSRRGTTVAGASETAEPDAMQVDVKAEEEEGRPAEFASALISPPHSNRALSPVVENGEKTAAAGSAPVPGPSRLEHTPARGEEEEEGAEIKDLVEVAEDVKPKKQKRVRAHVQTEKNARKDAQFLENFDPHAAWLPPETEASSYTAEFCKELERRYWKTCSFGKAPWYGADMQGSLFTDETTTWNVAHLPSTLTRLLSPSSKGLPGVNTPYLYFGMWRATFAWHVEDMDLFSINYIHFGAPKFWYAVPQARASALEQTLRSMFPGNNCPQFLRHKSYLASPTLLAGSSCRPNCLVQREGEFVITFPRGYHAGFNLGFNCAESVNFALDSWIDIGRTAKICTCVDFSVRIDVDQLLYERASEGNEVYRNRRKLCSIKLLPPSNPDSESEAKAQAPQPHPQAPHKRKAEDNAAPKPKKQRTKATVSSEQPIASSSKLADSTKQLKVTLKLPPPPKQPEPFPCCLCVSMSHDGLLRVQDPPAWWYEPGNIAAAVAGTCMAHADCASIVPETWVDVLDGGELEPDGEKERVVFGVDGIVKDRWNLKCSACSKVRHKTHGAPVQCTKGRCSKAFHVSCAKEGHESGIVFKVLREVEKEVVAVDNQTMAPPALSSQPTSDPVLMLHPGSTSAAASSSSSFIPTPPSAEQQPMDVDGNCSQPLLPSPDEPEPAPRTIKKAEFELLCHQHNPDTLALKKAQQQDRIRKQLLALPPMSRIKLRVTAGVFEVTLVRLIEESASVEVLWDQGMKREFKWRSVVFGDTDVAGSKPTVAAPDRSKGPSQPGFTETSAPLQISPGPSASTLGQQTTAIHLSKPSTYQQYQSWSQYQYASLPGMQPAPAPVAVGQLPASHSYSHGAIYPPPPQIPPAPSGYFPYVGGAAATSYGMYPQYGHLAAPVLSTPPSQPPAPYRPPADSQMMLNWQRPYAGPKIAPTPPPAPTLPSTSAVATQPTPNPSPQATVAAAEAIPTEAASPVVEALPTTVVADA
ncbi:uncharacterized protein BXZ73DRAFT_43542 [Epithele typhae]|uniref:uncharacterized protein n=1 Tax=Epithele typhae TaxID=378194 RepID=UPI00200837E4|nr:uncharacterized protein BXZ73DRAFT_43542 [Epithele typhae]KAH9939681.1 hypothetical protein BXZ73DRAFT_43542 [Epithele typhae]